MDYKYRAGPPQKVRSAQFPLFQCTFNRLLQYASGLALYFSTVGLALLKHVVPRSLQDVVGLLAPRSVERSLKPGEGRVAQHGLLKKAMYRHPDGTLHLYSALCTHLGCCVEWNPLDR
ncbi:hypothetical protein Vretimale_481 [Volvox reticuliferus]|uniref:Rieske domain-containing protein n=1 Tax=Volvox reticuliferus TaxID=1737510 RepID=A0A8J4FXC0_9CHLO|nr:hypothetical protein Vretimale_481 [Volvox reticuliferus]